MVPVEFIQLPVMQENPVTKRARLLMSIDTIKYFTKAQIKGLRRSVKNDTHVSFGHYPWNGIIRTSKVPNII